MNVVLSTPLEFFLYAAFSIGTYEFFRYLARHVRIGWKK